MSSAVPGPKINYQGNSKLDKEIATEEAAKSAPKLKKIEGVNVIESKPTLGKRFRASFGGQNLKTVALAVFLEVVIPTSKELLLDVIDEGSRRAVYGESGGGRRRSSASGVVQTIVGSANRARTTNYSNISTQSQVVSAPTSLSARERNTFDFSHLVFPDRAQAEEVMAGMLDAIQQYGMITVGGFYDLIGQSGTGFTDQKFAWDAREFAGTKVAKVREGWILDLPLPLEVQ